jgi:hypothetical protein
MGFVTYRRGTGGFASRSARRARTAGDTTKGDVPSAWRSSARVGGAPLKAIVSVMKAAKNRWRAVSGSSSPRGFAGFRRQSPPSGASRA